MFTIEVAKELLIIVHSDKQLMQCSCLVMNGWSSYWTLSLHPVWMHIFFMLLTCKSLAVKACLLCPYTSEQFSKSDIGMTKNSGFVWTIVWNGGQNVVFRNIRIRVVGAWIGKPGEKLLLLQYQASPISLPVTSVGFCRRVMAAFHHVFVYTCALGGGHTEHPSGLEWTIMWR